MPPYQQSYREVLGGNSSRWIRKSRCAEVDAGKVDEGVVRPMSDKALAGKPVVEMVKIDGEICRSALLLPQDRRLVAVRR